MRYANNILPLIFVLLATGIFMSANAQSDLSLEELRVALASGMGVDSPKADGTTLLMEAIYYRESDKARLLIESGADVNASNRYGMTPMFLAARAGLSDIGILLLSAGVNPNATNAEGETLLMAAAKSGSASLVRALLTDDLDRMMVGVDPNLTESWRGQTALMWAAAEGHAEVIQALVDGGANINKLSAYQKFIEPDEDKMQGGFVYPIIPKGRLSALHFAARNGQKDAVQALIRLGADLDIVDEEGSTPAMLAILNGHYEVAAMLINAGTDFNIQDKFGRNLLFIATDMHTLDASPRPGPKPYGAMDSLDIVRLVLKKGADPNLTLKTYLPQPTALDLSNPMLNEGVSPLFRASMSGDLEVIHLLLEAGADPYLLTAENTVGQYEQESATNLTNVVMAAAGLSWRHSISRGRVSDAIETLELFLENYDFDINAVNKAGASALHGAVMRGSPEIVEFLAQRGADFTLLARALYDPEGFYADEFYLSPLDLAMGVIELRLEPNPEIEAVLRRYMTQSDFAAIDSKKAELSEND
jgi:ankyrin repeat protein